MSEQISKRDFKKRKFRSIYLEEEQIEALGYALDERPNLSQYGKFGKQCQAIDDAFTEEVKAAIAGKERLSDEVYSKIVEQAQAKLLARLFADQGANEKNAFDVAEQNTENVLRSDLAATLHREGYFAEQEEGEPSLILPRYGKDHDELQEKYGDALQCMDLHAKFGALQHTVVHAYKRYSSLLKKQGSDIELQKNVDEYWEDPYSVVVSKNPQDLARVIHALYDMIDVPDEEQEAKKNDFLTRLLAPSNAHLEDCIAMLKQDLRSGAMLNFGSFLSREKAFCTDRMESALAEVGYPASEGTLGERMKKVNDSAYSVFIRKHGPYTEDEEVGILNTSDYNDQEESLKAKFAEQQEALGWDQAQVDRSIKEFEVLKQNELLFTASQAVFNTIEDFGHESVPLAMTNEQRRLLREKIKKMESQLDAASSQDSKSVALQREYLEHMSAALQDGFSLTVKKLETLSDETLDAGLMKVFDCPKEDLSARLRENDDAANSHFAVFLQDVKHIFDGEHVDEARYFPERPQLLLDFTEHTLQDINGVTANEAELQATEFDKFVEATDLLDCQFELTQTLRDILEGQAKSAYLS